MVYIKQNLSMQLSITEIAENIFVSKSTLTKHFQKELHMSVNEYICNTDLSLLIRHAGKELYHCRSVGVNHLPHQTTKSGTDGHKRLLDQKQQYFTAKWKKLHPELLDYTKKVGFSIFPSFKRKAKK